MTKLTFLNYGISVRNYFYGAVAPDDSHFLPSCLTCFILGNICSEATQLSAVSNAESIF